MPISASSGSTKSHTPTAVSESGEPRQPHTSNSSSPTYNTTSNTNLATVVDCSRCEATHSPTPPHSQPACRETECPEPHCPAVACPAFECPEVKCPEVKCPEVKCPANINHTFRICPKPVQKPCPPCAALQSELDSSLSNKDRFAHHRKLICSHYFGVLDSESEALFRDALIDSGTYTLFCDSLAKKEFRPRVDRLTEKLKVRKIVTERAEQMRMKALRELQRKVKTESTSLRNCRKRFPLDWHTCGMICLNYSKYFCL